jgi:signal transduction histidine kinase
MGFSLKSVVAQTAALLLAVAAFAAFARGLPATGLAAAIAALFSAAQALERRGIVNIPASGGISRQVDKQRLLALLDMTPAPMVLREGAGRFMAVNRAARELFKTSDLIAEPQTLAAAFDRPPADRQITLGDEVYGLALSDIEESGVARRLGVLTNISAERRAAEASAMRDLFQVVNHELMNSLTPITSMAETAADLLGDATESSREKARQATQRVAERARQLLHFAESTRSLARLPAPEPLPIDPLRWAEGVVALVLAQWQGKVEITLDCSQAPRLVSLDAEQMSQALLNLLSNACQAAAATTADPKVFLTIARDGERCLITVEDNGPGVPAELRETVFMPFFTTKEQGSGIGLPLARQIAAGHGAELRLDRSPTMGGARFVMRI